MTKNRIVIQTKFGGHTVKPLGLKNAEPKLTLHL